MSLHRTLRLLTPAAVAAAGLTTLLSAQAPGTTMPQGTVFRSTTNYVSTNVLARDSQGRFVPGLGPDDFRIYEDGMPQKIVTFLPVVGGRVMGGFSAANASAGATAPSEGLILPKPRAQSDVSGRIFIIFIDDLHFTAADTPRVRQLLEQVRDTLVHNDDLVGFVSTGPSAIEVNPVYDFNHRRFTEVIARVMGAALPNDEVVKEARFETAEGPTGMRFNVHRAFSTAYDMLDQLGKLTDRRKSFIYVSNGYAYDPFNESRYKQVARDFEALGTTNFDPGPQSEDDPNSPTAPEEKKVKQSDLSPWDTLADPMYRNRTMFAETDLTEELAQLVRAAKRSNVIFYTMDPRGLDASFMDAADSGRITQRDLALWITQTQGTLKVLGTETGGFCICDTNDPKPDLERIDNETSNYYMIGYYSTNSDPKAIRRRVRIEATRPDIAKLIYSDSYTTSGTPPARRTP